MFVFDKVVRRVFYDILCVIFFFRFVFIVEKFVVVGKLKGEDNFFV